MWKKWVVIHKSYGLPRAAQECRRYLENKGIRAKISTEEKRSVFVYRLLVPGEQQEQAEMLLKRFRQSAREK